MMENESGPASGIISYVEQHPEVALIAMSTHGKSGLNRWVFGSVAEKVLHASPIPMLLVRSTQNDELPGVIAAADYRSLLVPLDGSVFAEQALDLAGDLAHTLKAKVTLVSAIPDLPLATELVAPPAVVVPVTGETSILANYLAENRRKLVAKGLNVKTKLEYAPPAEAILRVGDAVHADLIVMATHGRTGLPRLWLGSIAMKVVQASSLPVLLVRSKERVQEVEPAFAGARVVARHGLLAYTTVERGVDNSYVHPALYSRGNLRIHPPEGPGPFRPQPTTATAPKILSDHVRPLCCSLQFTLLQGAFPSLNQETLGRH